MKEVIFLGKNQLKNSLLRDSLCVLIIALIYYLVGTLSVKLAFKAEGITAIWPASGIFLSSILLIRKNLRYYLVPVLFISQFLIDLQFNTSIELCLLFASALTLEATLSAWLIVRFVGERPTFNRVKQLFAFIVLSLILVNALTSSISAFGIFLFRQSPFLSSFRVWFSADAVGSLLFTPFIMTWAYSIDDKFRDLNRNQIAELLLLLGSMIIVNLFAVNYFNNIDVYFALLSYLTFPFLFWVALRFGIKETALVSIVLAIILLGSVQNGRFLQFQSASHLSSVIVLQLNLAIAALSSFFITTVINERKEMEDNLRESEEYFRCVFENSPIGKSITGLDGSMKTNKRMAEMLGYSPAEFQQKKGQDITHPKDIRLSEEVIDTLMKGKKRQLKFEKRYKHKDGSIIFAEVQSTLYKDNHGKPLFLITSITDITDQKKAQKELLAAKERAEESDRLKSAFLANMSHEIRTPMNGILGFAELLREPNLSGEEQQEYIGIIEKSGARMLNIINDIIDISKIESGLMEIHNSITNINEKMDFVYNFFRPEAENKGISLSYKTSLPFQDSYQYTDGDKLYSVLFNLVKNAIKYTISGSIEFGYSLVSQPDGQSAFEFFVRDSGIGIPMARQEAIFERFIQAEIADKMARQGAGLGLSISRAYVEMLGGSIWVESKEGQGSVFYFTLPRSSKTVEEEKNSIKIVTLNGKRVDDPSVSVLKILIAEDDDISASFIAKIVKGLGKEISIVASGDEAIKVCQNKPDLDLILMDIQMPGKSGYEATRQIRKFNKDVVIIAQTAYGLKGDKAKAILSGCNDYISKPIDPNELLMLIGKHCKNTVNLSS